MKLSMKSGKRVYRLEDYWFPFHRTKLNIFPYVQKCTENSERFLECSRCASTALSVSPVFASYLNEAGTRKAGNRAAACTLPRIDD